MGVFLADTWTTFSERMDAAKDAAASRRAPAGLSGGVTWKRPPAVVWRKVADVSIELGVSTARVKLLVVSGRFGRCKRGPGKGRPWLIPAFRETGGTYHLRVSPGKRGPKADRLPIFQDTCEDLPF